MAKASRIGMMPPGSGGRSITLEMTEDEARALASALKSGRVKSKVLDEIVAEIAKCLDGANQRRSAQESGIMTERDIAGPDMGIGTHEVLEAVRRAAPKKQGGVDAFDVAKELRGSPNIAGLAKVLGDLAAGGSIRVVEPSPDATRRRYLPK